MNEKSFIQALMLVIGGASARLDLEKVRPGNDPFSDEVYEKVSARPGTPIPDNEGGDIIRRVENDEQAEMLLAKAHALQKLIERLAEMRQNCSSNQMFLLMMDSMSILRAEISERIDAFKE